MGVMEFFEVIRRRRSIRHFTPEPVREEDLLAMLEAARLAPSAHNEQPWHFIVIRDQELKSKLRDIVNAIIEAQIEMAEDEARKKELEERRFYATNFASAPVVVVVLTRPFPRPSPEEQPPFNQGLQSVAAAITQLHLAATALGYGSCWTTLPLEFAGSEIEAILGVEKPWFAVAILPIGVPARMPKEVKRKSLEEVVTFT